MKRKRKKRKTSYKMDWSIILEPYFAEFPPGLRTEIVRQIVQQFPPTPTLESQQAVMRQIPDIVVAVKQQFAQQTSAMVSNAGYATSEQEVTNMIQQGMGSVELPPELGSIFTGNKCQRTRIVNLTPITGNLNLDLVLGLWRFFRLTNPVSLQKYSNVQHLTLDITTEQINQYGSLYSQLEKTFLNFLNLNKGSLVFITGNDIVMIVKEGSQFTIFEQQGTGATLMLMFEAAPESNVLITVECLD